MSRQTVDLSDADWIHEWINWFGSHRPEYQKFAAVLQDVLQVAADRHAPLAIVQSRTKNVASYADKIQRKIRKYRKTDDKGRLLYPITDLCGARVITHTLTQVKAVCKFIEEHFDIDQANSVDVAARLKVNEFGYLSVHYIVRFRPDTFPTREVPIRIPRGICNLDAEIQVRTLLEHAWADIEHDLCYKTAMKVPDKWEREFARLAAILEDADEAFCRTASGLAAYAGNYGAYMSEEQIRDEIAKARVVLRVAPKNAEVAHRIAKLSICLGDWTKAVRVLTPFVDMDFAPILRDLGIAMCKSYKKGGRNFRRGQNYLSRAIALDPSDSDALASLGGTWRGIDDDKALSMYRKAFEANPCDPYSLGNYLEHEIAKRNDLSPVSFALPNVKEAIQNCRAQIEVGMNMPWAFYDMGKFRLLLKEPYESLNLYAKAVSVSVSRGMIETSLKSVERLKGAGDQIPGLESVCRFLNLALCARFGHPESVYPPKEKVLKKRRPLRGPIVIVAGDCGSEVEQEMQGYRRLMLDAFLGFGGTIISGGTSAGVSGIVGDIGSACRGKVRTIGYAPSRAVAEKDRHRYHEVRYSGGKDFSAFEPQQAWRDILDSGVSPSQVKVLGIGGGCIAASEYRMAMALGARVAVIEGSGGAASNLLTDDDWCDSGILVRLPPDAMTIRAFIGPKIPTLPANIRETISKAIHEAYRRDQADRFRSEELSQAEWDKLLDHLKESNRQQADHILEKLAVLGYTVRKAKKEGILRVKKFTTREVEILSEIEHGRWNAERLLDGWTLGEKKDVKKKISPYLVPWKQLPEDVKEWDRQTIRGIPGFLAEVGLEIRRRL